MSTENKKPLILTEEFETVSDKDGRVVILEAEGESVEGVFVGMGRNIPHGEGKEIATIALVPVNGELEKIIVPSHTVIERAVESLYDKGVTDEGNAVLKITYLGKKKSSNGNNYHDFKLAARAAKHEETTRAGKFLPIQ